MSERPKVNSAGQKELDKTAAQIDAFEQNIKDMTIERMEGAKPQEIEAQTKLSQKEISNSKDIYLKPIKTQPSKEPFNEKWRNDYNFQIGNNIEVWTKRFPGQPAEYWEVPTNKPIWGPRYLAEQIRNCNYHVFSMDERVPTGAADQMGTYTGKIVVDTVKSRLSANPVNTSTKSIFMGAQGF
jgi:hypothetical protein